MRTLAAIFFALVFAVAAIWGEPDPGTAERALASHNLRTGGGR